MCGRFTLSKRDLGEVAAFLDAELALKDAERWRARYNVAPSDAHWVVVPDENGRRRLIPAVWGFSTGSAPGEAAKLVINARSESVAHKPMFRDAFAHRRCVVPADGFFEWTGTRKQRQPIWYHAPDGRVLAFAALWEPRPDGTAAFTILTTGASPLVQPVHDRMPVVLPPACIGEWLARPRLELCVPAADGVLIATPVSPRANSVEHDDADCITPAPLAGDPQLKLL